MLTVYFNINYDKSQGNQNVGNVMVIKLNESIQSGFFPWPNKHNMCAWYKQRKTKTYAKSSTHFKSFPLFDYFPSAICFK